VKTAITFETEGDAYEVGVGLPEYASMLEESAPRNPPAVATAMRESARHAQRLGAHVLATLNASNESQETRVCRSSS
jgi:hypothetical protein